MVLLQNGEFNSHEFIFMDFLYLHSLCSELLGSEDVQNIKQQRNIQQISAEYFAVVLYSCEFRDLLNIFTS